MASIELKFQQQRSIRRLTRGCVHDNASRKRLIAKAEPAFPHMANGDFPGKETDPILAGSFADRRCTREETPDTGQ